MSVKKIVLLIFIILTLVLEALPFGAVLNFAQESGEPLRQTFSYFDPISFGYANFGPFLTALLTCVLAALGVLSLFKASRLLSVCTSGVALVALLTSLVPLLYGTSYFTVLGGCISGMLLTTLLVSLWRAA